jgi:signal transduction histidine kinase
MLKKLKRRVVSISMALVCVVLAFFYIMLCMALQVNSRWEVRNILEDSAEAGSFNFLPSIGTGELDDYGMYYGNICVVSYSILDCSIRILEGSSAFMDDDMLVKAVSKALSSEASFNSIESMGLFYYRSDNTFGCNIAFTSMGPYNSSWHRMLIGGGIFFVLVSLVLYIINRFVIGLSLKPVERAWEQQQNFIGDASHELKTPLTVILTNGNILMAHQNDTIRDQIKWVDSTNEEATHMKDLVDKLLILAKTDNMRQNKLFSDVDLSDLSMRLALQFEPVAYEKGVTIHTDIESGIHMTGDQTALNQIVHILLDNAVKYAGIGGEAELSLKRKQNYIYLSTRNTGIPIPPEDLPHIFERFYRSDKVRTTGNGYGIGLAICKNLAELHKATINVTSDEADGTVFTVRFRSSRRN